MDIQDREFDELLRSKLDGFEAQPSAKVWPGISDGLDSATRRKTILPWLTIAASIAVLIGMGVLFMLKKTNIHSPNPVKNSIVKAAQPTTHQLTPSLPAQAVAIPVQPVKVKESRYTAKVQSSRPANIKAPNNIDTIASPSKNVKSDDRQLMVDLAQKPASIAKPVVPDQIIPLASVTNIDQSNGSKPDKLASQGVSDNKKDSVLTRRRHKIRNFGDLVNVVVDKLDKRKDKVIQFADDEEGDSHLTGVNLGIVKIKKGE